MTQRETVKPGRYVDEGIISNERKTHRISTVLHDTCEWKTLKHTELVLYYMIHVNGRH